MPLYPRSVPHDLTIMDFSRYIVCENDGENGRKSGFRNW
jgi:hypothetical protein